jgi:hypothetical protein
MSSKEKKNISVNRVAFCQAVLELNVFPHYKGDQISVEGVDDKDLIDNFLNAVDSIPKTKEIEKAIPKSIAALYNAIVDVVDEGGVAVFEAVKGGGNGGTEPTKAAEKKAAPKTAEKKAEAKKPDLKVVEKKAEAKPPAKPAAKPAAKKEAAPAPKKAEAKKADPPKKAEAKKGDGKKKEAKPKQSLNKFGHQIGTMSGDIDDLFYAGATKEKVIKMLMDKYGRTRELAERKVRDHAGHLKNAKNVKVDFNADKGTYKIATNPRQ